MKRTFFLLFSIILVNCHNKPTSPKHITISGPDDSEMYALHDKGIAMAKEDLKNGIIGYYFYGIGIPPYSEILKKEYGVVIHDEGCMPTGIEAGYNEIMRKAMNDKFGKDIIETLEREQTFEMPVFKGGKSKLGDFLQKKIRYPLSSKDSIEGTVYVTFIVDSIGRIISPRVLKGINPDIDSECIRVVKIMPRWIPATTAQGKKVSAAVNLPIKFKN